MLTHLGFSASVSVNGVPLPEYSVSVDEKIRRVSCWIPGIEGQNFTIHWCDSGSKITTCGCIVLDGFRVSGRFLGGEGATSRSGLTASNSTERPFVFKKTGSCFSSYNGDSLPTEQPIARNNQPVSTEAGSILLKIKRIKVLTPRAANPIPTVPLDDCLGFPDQGDLRVAFGDEREVATPRSPTTWNISAYESDKTRKPKTYVSFLFRYRSPDFLEAQGIASAVGHTRRFAQLPISRGLGTIPSMAISTTGCYSGGKWPISPLNSSPESSIGQLPLSCASTPLQSEADDASVYSPSASESSGPSRKKTLALRWVIPNSRVADSRRTVSWKMKNDSGGSKRSIRGVERHGVEQHYATEDNTAFEGAFFVSQGMQDRPLP